MILRENRTALHNQIGTKHAVGSLPPAPDEVVSPLAWLPLVSRLSAQNERLSSVLIDMERSEAKPPAQASSRIFLELERERSRIAASLHAGAGQPLAGIRLNLELLDACRESLPPNAQEAIRRLHLLSESALAEVRAVSHRLHPPDWQVLSSAQALRRLLDEIGLEATFAESHLDIRDLPDEPDQAARIVLYRCAQECIANVVRHSGATRIEVSLIPLNGRVQLEVADNGKGIPSQPSAGGLGLNAIRNHVESVGGTCTIKSGAQGTRITVLIPLSQDA